MRAFFGSLFYGLSPALTAGIVLYFASGSAGWLLWILSGFMFLLALYLSVQCVFVHLNRLYLDDARIKTVNPLHTAELRWAEIVSATLRERVNSVSRTDRILILKSRRATLLFNTSTLSEPDETAVLAKVRAQTSLVVQRDKPTI